MSHMQLVMMIIVYGSVAFVSFFGVFGEQGKQIALLAQIIARLL